MRKSARSRRSVLIEPQHAIRSRGTGGQGEVAIRRAPQYCRTSFRHRPDRGQRLWRARRSENAATATLGWNLPQPMDENVNEARRGNRNGWAGRGSTTRPPCPRYGERQRSVRSRIAESLAFHQLRHRRSASSRIMPKSVSHLRRTTKKFCCTDRAHLRTRCPSHVAADGAGERRQPRIATRIHPG